MAHRFSTWCLLLFRHGDRSPMHQIPSDLYTEIDWPQGYAQLTKIGIRQAYELGQFLRDWYNGFLSRRYVRKEVYIESTSTERTLMSAQAVTASLFIPEGAQTWQPGVLWQPIPTHPSTWGKLDHKCRSEIVRVEKENIAKWFRRTYKKTFEEIEAGLGTPLSSLGYLWGVYDALKCEHIHNKTWPSWVSEELFYKMEEILPLHHKEIFTLSPDRADLLSKMIDDMTRFMQDPSTEMKAYIHSGHDTTVLCLLCAMGVYNARMSPYSAAVMVELHYGNWTDDESDHEHEQHPSSPAPDETRYSEDTVMTDETSHFNDSLFNATVISTTTSTLPTTTTTQRLSRHLHGPAWFVQVWFRNETHRDPYKLTLPGCTSDCPWERFIELTLPAVTELYDKVSMCGMQKKELHKYHKLWRVMFVTAGAGGVVMLVVVAFSALCLFQHRKRRQRLQAIYRQLNTEDIPMAEALAESS